MIYSVFGQRDVGQKVYNDYAHVESCMSSIDGVESLILGGGSTGLDALVRRWAEKHHVEHRIILPNLYQYPGDPHRAFDVQKERMIHQSEACIIFTDGVFRGTLQLISKIIVDRKSTIVFPM